VLSAVGSSRALGTDTVVSIPAWTNIGKSALPIPLSIDFWPSSVPDTKKVSFCQIGPPTLPTTRLKPRLFPLPNGSSDSTERLPV
jgi:hypothetical protein